jgi:regulation of enolase protein 1 (concanavalin A-like superfamily)
MIRETLDAGSSNAAMVVTPARGVGFQYRVATGGDSGPKRGGSAYNTLTAPQWVRVTRDGTTLTGYYSQDGLNWTQAGQVTISMTNTVLVGLGASSKDGTTITAVFDSVAIAPSSPPLPDITPPTVPQDLMVIASGASSVNLSWSASTDSGSGIAGYRLYRDGVAMADVVGTSYLDTELTPNTNYTYTVSAFDASVPANESNQSAPVSVTTDATISWQGLDIGAVGISGSFVENSGTFTLQGGDGKIWSAADSFYFVYKTLDGDGEILSRVSSVTSTAAWGKAAVMIRETLDAGSTNATMIVTPSRGVGFQYRATTDGDSGPKRGGAAYNALTAPKWIRVTRVGTTLTGYYSEDGLNWTQAGQVTIAMANTVYVGLGVSSANTTISAEFDSVSAISLP